LPTAAKRTADGPEPDPASGVCGDSSLRAIAGSAIRWETRGVTHIREGACRWLADGVDIRIIQLMLGHASIQQTQRYLNVTDEELRRGLEVSWNNKGRPLRLASGS